MTDKLVDAELKIFEPGSTITARVVIKNEEDKILFLQKDETSKASGLWELPGGNVEDGEDILEGIVREIKVETGLDIKKEELNFLGAFEYLVPVDGVGKRVVCQFSASVGADRSKVVIGTDSEDRHSDFKWMSVEEINQLRKDGKILGNSLHFDDDFKDNPFK